MKKGFAALHWDQPPTYNKWKSEIAETKSLGFAVDRSNYISGVTILAVPLLDQKGNMGHSLVAIGISERIETIGVSVIAEEMMRIRDGVASLLVISHAEASADAGRPRRARQAVPDRRANRRCLSLHLQ